MEYDKKNGFKKIESEPSFHLAIANSNIEHSTKTVVDSVNQFKQKDENTFSTLCEKESKLIQDVLELLKENNIKELGKKVSENQEYLETIGISNDKLRDMILVGNSKSFGSKVTGAGGGGCIFALTDESNLVETTNQFKRNNYDCFSVKIDLKGLDTF